MKCHVASQLPVDAMYIFDHVQKGEIYIYRVTSEHGAVRLFTPVLKGVGGEGVLFGGWRCRDGASCTLR